MLVKKNRILKWLGLGLLSVLVLGLIAFATFIYAKFNPMPWDTPGKLSGVTDTIEVWDIQFACDCAEWGIVGEDIPEDGLLEDYSIFIEAAHGAEKYEDATLPEGCWAANLKLIGQFYTDEGISRDYDIMHQKPNKARVFRYSSYTVTKQRCVNGTDKYQ